MRSTQRKRLYMGKIRGDEVATHCYEYQYNFSNNIYIKSLYYIDYKQNVFNFSGTSHKCDILSYFFYRILYYTIHKYKVFLSYGINNVSFNNEFGKSFTTYIPNERFLFCMKSIGALVNHIFKKIFSHLSVKVKVCFSYKYKCDVLNNFFYHILYNTIHMYKAFISCEIDDAF